MFDEQPDGEQHGECAVEIHNLRHLLGQCYAKLMKFGVENSDPFLMDELKLTLMQCYEEPFGKAEQVEWCGLHAKHRDALAELSKYFTSGNSVPVERATILAKDFWHITGLTPNVEVMGGPGLFPARPV